MKPQLTPDQILSILIERDNHREEDWLATIGLPKPLYELFLRHPEELETVRDIAKIIRVLEVRLKSYSEELEFYRFRSHRVFPTYGDMVRGGEEE